MLEVPLIRCHNISKMNEKFKVGDKVISTKSNAHGEIVATTVIESANPFKRLFNIFEPHSVLVRFNYDKFDCPGRKARPVSQEYSVELAHEYLKLA